MTANLFLMATLGLAATGAGFLAAPHAAAWVDAALDDCADADTRAFFSGKHARMEARAEAKAEGCAATSAAEPEDEEECEREKAQRRARATHDPLVSASVDVRASVSA